MSFVPAFLRQEKCVECGVGHRRSFTCFKCKKGPLCSTCANNATIVFADGEAAGDKLPPFAVHDACLACCRASSTLAADRSVDEYGPAKGEALSVILLHGGGTQRLLYRRLAQQLAARGFRCVCPDLPGHGSLVDQPLTVASAVARIKGVADDFTAPWRGIAPVLLGGSLGGFTGMEALGAHPDAFSAAVILCASQTVGAGASFKAVAGLWFMGGLVNKMMSSTVVRQMMGIVVGNNNIDQVELRGSSLDAQMWFQRGPEQVATLRATNSLAALRKFSGPVLFMNGSKDHQDMLADQLRIAKANSPALSKSVVFQGGDHFFSHDVRYQEETTSEIIAFVEAVAAQPAK